MRLSALFYHSGETKHKARLCARGDACYTRNMITLTLHDMSYGGEAVGRHDGKVIFVPLAIPGETVRVELVEERERYAHARLLEVLTPAECRVTPPCPYFGTCGGCHWQHIAYPAQLAFKREIVTAQLQRLGKQTSPLVQPVVGMDTPWAYRNHAQAVTDAQGRLGYNALKSHDVVPVDTCCILHPLVDELWAAFDLEADAPPRLVLRAGIATGEQLVILESDDNDIPALELDLPVSCLYQGADGTLTLLAGNDHYHERLAGRTYRVSAPSFFQVNTTQAERLVDVVRRYAAPQPGQSILDAYCGVGALGLSLVQEGVRLVGIESSPWAVDDALANATDDEDVTLIEGAVEEVLPEMEDTFNTVVLDPPRAGCAPEALEAVVRAQPGRIVYVSCDPATLARDLARLSTSGYRLVEAQPVDMFPQTYHVECVALMTST
jgi:23S rRNA (uracil1939-C5)-methyltransferase